MPVKKREKNEPFYDVLLKLFNCTFLNSQATFKRKSNLKITKKFEKKEEGGQKRMQRYIFAKIQLRHTYNEHSPRR